MHRCSGGLRDKPGPSLFDGRPYGTQTSDSPDRKQSAVPFNFSWKNWVK